MEKKEIMDLVGNEGLSKSERMRRLYDGGIEIGEISKLIGVRYNFVYNVVSGEMRMRGVEMRKRRDGESVKDKIIGLLVEGKECVEISKELKCNINMVYKYRKEVERGLIDVSKFENKVE